MFSIDSNVKQEAINFAALMNAMNRSGDSLDPIFELFAREHDVTIPMIDNQVIAAYSDYFNIDASILFNTYARAEKAFLTLRKTDEIIKKGSVDYPPLLAETDQAPRFLYIRGRKSLLFEKRTVALVGSRQATVESREKTKRLARILGENGITVVSGLAKGIDVSGHEAALENGFNTIAVIGTNLNQYYPKENEMVQREIEKKGLIVSQFSPATETKRWFFPLRNGVMSGLSLATVIMEAGETSGALNQADYALRQGRLVLIPNTALDNTNISWPRKYEKKGAKVVYNSTDILSYLSQSHIFRNKEEEPIQQTIDDYLTSQRHINYEAHSDVEFFRALTVGV